MFQNQDSSSSSDSLLLKMIKAFVFSFLLASISFVVFSALYSNQSRWLKCPICLARNSQTPTLTNNHHHNYHHISNSYHQETTTTTTNISHIVFGIGGSVATWKERRLYSELWWKPNLTRGFAWLDDKPSEDSAATALPWLPYRVSEDRSKRAANRISRIVAENYRLGLKHVRWFVMGDDDTVFFPDNLVTVLSRYDHNEMYYIGGNSESVEQDVVHSYGTAFGGGGFAISYALAVQLDKVLDGCIDRYAHFYGSDERVAACLSEIGVPLTRNLGFHQFDIRGNPYGLLAAHPVTPLVSLHHLEAVAPLFPNSTRLDSLRSLFGAYKVDPGRTLQHSFCHYLERNWSISVSWGYTVQIYPSVLTATVLQTALLTFKTWRSFSNAPFVFNTRPISSDPCERPLLYFLDQVEELGNGETLTSYKRFVGETGFDCDRAAMAVHRVNVSAKILGPKEWKKAPRRQCCEVVNRTDGVASVIHVRMGRCKPWESVSTPL